MSRLILSSVVFAIVVLSVVAAAYGAAGETEEQFVEFEGHSLHTLSAGPLGRQSVLLLHGARYDATTWQKLGSIGHLADHGYRAIALDLPGFGKSKKWKIDRASFLEKLLPELAIGKPVIIAPSMSGAVAFPLLAARPDLVAGFIGVAPAASEIYARRLKNSGVPALIVWGERDRVFPVARAKRIAASFARSSVVILKGASHPCYLDHPAQFHDAVLKFLAQLGGQGGSS